MGVAATFMPPGGWGETCNNFLNFMRSPCNDPCAHLAICHPEQSGCHPERSEGSLARHSADPSLSLRMTVGFHDSRASVNASGACPYCTWRGPADPCIVGAGLAPALNALPAKLRGARL